MNILLVTVRRVSEFQNLEEKYKRDYGTVVILRSISQDGWKCCAFVVFQLTLVNQRFIIFLDV
jgi:hypothetical protein